MRPWARARAVGFRHERSDELANFKLKLPVAPETLANAQVARRQSKLRYYYSLGHWQGASMGPGSLSNNARSWPRP